MVLFEVGTLAASSWRWIGSIDHSFIANTVDYHIKIVMKKLGTGNRMVAAKKAEQLGLIEPQFGYL